MFMGDKKIHELKNHPNNLEKMIAADHSGEICRFVIIADRRIAEEFVSNLQECINLEGYDDSFKDEVNNNFENFLKGGKNLDCYLEDDYLNEFHVLPNLEDKESEDYIIRGEYDIMDILGEDPSLIEKLKENCLENKYYEVPEDPINYRFSEDEIKKIIDDLDDLKTSPITPWELEYLLKEYPLEWFKKSVVEEIISNENWGYRGVKATLADLDDLPPEFIYILSRDTDFYVRQAIALRNELPEDIIKNLVIDKNDQVRQSAAKWRKNSNNSTR